MTSPILNPAIIALLLVFFGPLPTVVYALITFVFAICVGLLLDKLGFSRYVKNVNVSGGCGCEDITWEKLEGTFWQKQWQACKYAVKDAIGLFKGVIGWLLLGAGIGAFIYGFVPTELLENFAGADNLWAIPLAAVIGIPMYIRVETMIPIAGILMDKGVSAGIVIALILGGAGASIPEVSLLNSIFKKQMVVTFVLCIFLVAVGTASRSRCSLFSAADSRKGILSCASSSTSHSKLRCRRSRYCESAGSATRTVRGSCGPRTAPCTSSKGL